MRRHDNVRMYKDPREYAWGCFEPLQYGSNFKLMYLSIAFLSQFISMTTTPPEQKHEAKRQRSQKKRQETEEPEEEPIDNSFPPPPPPPPVSNDALQERTRQCQVQISVTRLILRGPYCGDCEFPCSCSCNVPSSQIQLTPESINLDVNWIRCACIRCG